MKDEVMNGGERARRLARFGLALSCGIAAAIGSVASSAQTQSAEPTSIPRTVRLHGRVVTEELTPIRAAIVRLAVNPRQTVEDMTDEDGRFEFSGVPNGAVVVTVSRAGFVTRTFRASQPNSKSGTESWLTSPGERPAFTLRSGADVEMRNLILVRGGAIAGRVVDQYGDPVAHVFINALLVAYARPGMPDFVIGGARQTNDLGEYRIHGLLPGTYFISAGLPPFFTGRAAASAVITSPSSAGGILGHDAGQLPAVPDTVFYPGTSDSAQARPIAVEAGDQIAGIDLALIPAAGGAIQGRIVDAAGLPVSARVKISAVPAGLLSHRQLPQTTPQGRFSSGVMPVGTYLIEVATSHGEFAVQQVELQGTVEITIGTRPGFPVRGRVLVDGSAAGALNPNAGVRFLLPGSMQQSVEVRLEDAGRFSATGIAGLTRISPTNLPPGLWLHRVMSRGMDVTDSGLDVRDAGHTAVEIHLTARPSRLDGEVITLNGRPAVRPVLIFSEDPRWWTVPDSRRVRRVPVHDSKFSVSGLPAGRYLVSPDGDIDIDNWADPVKLERLRATAAMVTVADAATSTVTVRQR